MRIKFSLRTLFLFPVVLLIVLRLAINVEVELPNTKWPARRWNMNLVDVSGQVLSSQDETWIQIGGPTLSEGAYVVREVFPGLIDYGTNLFASTAVVVAGVGVHVSVSDDKPMKIVDEDSGKTLRAFIGSGTTGFRLHPGRYSVAPMTPEEVAEWDD